MIGILPVGALGVAYFYHLTGGLQYADGSVRFLLRSLSSSSSRWQGANLQIERGGDQFELPLAELDTNETLLTAAANETLPEIVLACTNPDQLAEVLRDFVTVVEHEHQAGRLLAGKEALPALVLCSNGIYFSELQENLARLLEESTRQDRLPNLQPDILPRILGRLIRGAAAQPAARQGSSSEAVYRPGPAGRTLLAGGDKETRAAAAATLSMLGARFEDAGDLAPERAEFDKAIMNFVSNFFGLLAAIDGAGAFRPLTISEIVTPERHARMRELAEIVLRIGRGLDLYEHESSDDLFARTLQLLAPVAEHVPSSVQWVQHQLAAGVLKPNLTPNEAWLLRPLQTRARALGDTAGLAYFEQLEAELVAAISRAAASQPA